MAAASSAGRKMVASLLLSSVEKEVAGRSSGSGAETGLPEKSKGEGALESVGERLGGVFVLVEVPRTEDTAFMLLTFTEAESCSTPGLLGLLR